MSYIISNPCFQKWSWRLAFIKMCSVRCAILALSLTFLLINSGYSNCWKSCDQRNWWRKWQKIQVVGWGVWVHIIISFTVLAAWTKVPFVDLLTLVRILLTYFCRSLEFQGLVSWNGLVSDLLQLLHYFSRILIK